MYSEKDNNMRWMPVYNSVAARGKVSPLGGPAGALTPPEESSLMDGALGGFFDHMLGGMKEPTTQEKIDSLLIARDNAINNLRRFEANNASINANAPKVNTPAYDAHLKDKRLGIIPEYQMFNGTKYRQNWDKNMGSLAGKHPNSFKEGNPLEVELLHIDAELKRLQGVSGYYNNGQPYKPEQKYVNDDSIFHRDNLSGRKDVNVGNFFTDIFNGIKGN